MYLNSISQQRFVLMPNIKFIGTSEKDGRNRLRCQLHIKVAKGKYQTLKFPLKSIITGKPYVIRQDIISSKSSNGVLLFDEKKMTREEIRISKEIKELMSLIQLAIGEIEEECTTENRVLLPTDFTTSNIYDKVAKLSDVQKSPLVNVVGKAKENKEIYLDAYWEDFVEQIKKGTILYNGTKYSWNTIKAFQNSYRCFLAYQKTLPNTPHLRFDEIDRTVYDGFVSFMENKGECPNTIGGRIKKLKALMNRARIIDNLHDNVLYLGFNPIGEDVDVIYLTEDELKRIYELKLEGEKAFLVKYRDIFLFGCYTGMRGSDLLKVQSFSFTETARGTRVFKYVPYKTIKKSQVPLSIPLTLWDECDIIAKRNNYSFPKVTEQKLRKYIKEIGKLAEIDEDYYVTSGSMKRKEPYKKYELMTIHTARRTFCTLLYFGNYGLSANEIMKMSGHTKESTFMKYIRATGDEVADKIVKKIEDKKNHK